jgi:ACDE family multidrug resistance protein
LYYPVGITDVATIETLFGEDAGVLRRSHYQLLLLANINAALGTVLVSPLLEALTGPFAVTEVRIGLMITMFTAPSVVGIPLVGLLADTYGRKPILVASLVLFGSAGTAIAFTTDFTVVLVLRMLQGIGYAGITPVVITSIGDRYRDTREATAQGLRFTSTGAAQATFPVLAGVLVTVTWQYPFFLYAIALPIAGFVYLRYEEPSRQRADKAGESDDGSYVRELVWLVSRPRVLAAVTALGVPAFIYIGFLAYNSFLIVRVLGSTPSAAGLVITIVSIVNATAASQAGRVTARFGTRTIPLIGANVLMTAGLAVFALAPTLVVAYSGVAIMGLGLGTAFSLLRSVITGLAPPELRGGLVGLGESTIRLANSIAPVAMGASIALIQPEVGFDTSIRWILFSVGVVGGTVGIVATLIARAAPAVATDRDGT